MLSNVGGGSDWLLQQDLIPTSSTVSGAKYAIQPRQGGWINHRSSVDDPTSLPSFLKHGVQVVPRTTAAVFKATLNIDGLRFLYCSFILNIVKYAKWGKTEVGNWGLSSAKVEMWLSRSSLSRLNLRLLFMLPFNVSSLNSQLAYFLKSKTISLMFQSVLIVTESGEVLQRSALLTPKYSPAFFLLHEHVQSLFFTSCVSFSISLCAEPHYFSTRQIEGSCADYKLWAVTF